MEALCSKLDSLAVRYFETLAKLEEERGRLQTLLKEGYFKLSKSRYSMGNKAVSSLQYDINNMKALATVAVSKPSNESECLFDLERKKPAKIRKARSASKEIHSTLPSSLDSPEIRRRKKGTVDDDGEMLEIQLQDFHITNENAENSSPDPITWFGVLVPPTLRQGQASFIQAIDVCCILVNLQSELEHYRIEYRDLLEKKQKQMKQVEAEKLISEKDKGFSDK